jgi:hypothetical protein
VIVPIAFSVKRENTPEEFVLTESELLPRSTNEQFRVTMVLLSTDTGDARGFSARVLFDQGAEPWHGMVTIYQSSKPAGQGGEILPTFASREYMTALRDQLNKLLAEMEQSE